MNFRKISYVFDSVAVAICVKIIENSIELFLICYNKLWLIRVDFISRRVKLLDLFSGLFLALAVMSSHSSIESCIDFPFGF